MKNAIYGFVLAILVLLGAAATYAIVFPGEARGHVRHAVRTIAGGKKQTNQGIASARPSSGNNDHAGTAAKPVVPASNEAVPPNALAQVDAPKPADGASSPPAKRPPSRAEVEKRGNTIDPSLMPKRRATFVGPTTDPIDGSAPPPSMYPFRVDRRVIPNPSSIRLELSIRNQSGIFWDTAFVALRSAGHEEAIVFRINDWRLDEVVGLDYTFPKDELEPRLKELRVVRVSGSRRQSALSDLMNEKRNEASGGQPTTVAISGEGGSMRASGLLGMLAVAREAETGVKVQYEAAPGASSARKLPAIVFPLEATIPAEIPLMVDESDPKRKEAAELFRESHKAALSIQEDITALIKQVNENADFGAAMKNGGTALQDRIRGNLAAFNKKTLDLALAIERAKDNSLRSVTKANEDLANNVFLMTSSLESDMKRRDPKFSVTE